ncbi:MAG: hypothetical protein C4527_08080 [Candidatus Omnitrophota bacterium]|nr:MAG: hypothetical protein C4527_08080 [Candidatus Omnitrophota bacterium]
MISRIAPAALMESGSLTAAPNRSPVAVAAAGYSKVSSLNNCSIPSIDSLMIFPFRFLSYH